MCLSSPGHTSQTGSLTPLSGDLLSGRSAKNTSPGCDPSSPGGCIDMKKRNASKTTIGLAVLALGLVCCTRTARAQVQDDNGDKKSPTPPGLYITPTVLAHAVQQDLNPGLGLPYFATNYPNFVAGEAVKAVVSPDGKTL